MGYLSPEYSHDLFVSYSHGDLDQTGKSDLKTWSQVFVRELEAELRAVPKFSRIAAFLDESTRSEHSLDQILPLSDQVRAAVEGSALLVILMSPHYLNSGWCRDERDWWLAHHARTGDLRGRVVVLRVWPTDHADWPEPLLDRQDPTAIGFWLHSRESVNHGTRPFGWKGTTSDADARTGELLRLVNAIGRRLEQIERDLEVRRQLQRQAARLMEEEGGQFLYLHAREAHRQVWDRISAELRAQGYIVMPGEPEPTVGDPKKLREVSDERKLLMADCDAVLLIGTEDGLALDRDMAAIGRNRRNLARQDSEKLLPCALLDTVGPAVKTQPRLENARNLGIRWLDGTDPAWPETIRDWLRAAGERLKAAA
jgi:hypothetical protein